MRDWSAENNVSMFYFEAFDEPWKGGETGSESHFGIFTVDGQAKYAIWDLVDDNTFSGLTRGGNTITKTYNGVLEDLKEVYWTQDKPNPFIPYRILSPIH